MERGKKRLGGRRGERGGRKGMPQLLRRCEGRERRGMRGRLQLLMRGEGKGEGREEEGEGDYSPL